ncbi:MAG TPA: hypothetical protein PLJ21_09855, partial [Pseudobdellovibrionaceae bacterium]|nr:hypothetical protein [Pseudobdellovibrionaceae bacterium]
MEIWKNIKYSFWRFFALRKINLNYEFHDYEFKLAESIDEYFQAFQVLYDSYFELGFTEQTPSKTYIVFQHLLPSTALLIAKYKGEVVGTVSLVRESKMGLPIQKYISLQLKKDFNTRYAEISSLCIKKSFRQSKQGNVFFPLLAFMYQFATKHFDVSDFIIAVYPRHEIYYRGLMGFQRLHDTFEFYGAPALALRLNLKNAYSFFAEKYGQLAESRNLLYYFTEYQFREFNFNLPSKNTLQTAPLSAHILKTFIQLRPSLKTQIMQDHLMVLLSSLPIKERHKFIDYIVSDLIRSTSRYDVSISGKLKVNDLLFINCKVMNITNQGMLIQLDNLVEALVENHEYSLVLDAPL